MIIRILIIFFAFTNFSYAEENKIFGQWLVSCRPNLMTAKNECFIGTQFNNKEGRGSIIFTKFYLAVAHNELNLQKGVDFKIDNNSNIESYMNTGINVFFKNDDRKLLLEQMSRGENLEIIIKGITNITKSLDGFKKAYNFYTKKINS